MAPGMMPVAASSAGSRTSIRIMFEGVEEGEREICVFIYLFAPKYVRLLSSLAWRMW